MSDLIILAVIYLSNLNNSVIVQLLVLAERYMLDTVAFSSQVCVIRHLTKTTQKPQGWKLKAHLIT